MRVEQTDADGRFVRSGNQANLQGMDKVHDRLKKLLAMTQSPNEREAGIAAAKLQEMLTEWNLSIADLEARGQAAPAMREQGHDLGKAAFKWKLDLAEGIAEFYYCAPIVNRVTKSVAFVGRPENVDALQMLYAWVIDQIKAIATTERRTHYDQTGEHIDPLRWQVAFGEGAVVRLIERLRELKARQQEDATRDSMGDITALVLHRQSEVSDYLEEKFGYRVDGKKTKSERESDARWAKWEEERAVERAKQDTLRIHCQASGNMQPYYEAYPHENPEAVAKREKADQAMRAKWRKQEERNARRRTGSYRPGPAVDYEKREQVSKARAAGKAAAGKVNLQPFLSGATDRTKIGG